MLAIVHSSRRRHAERERERREAEARSEEARERAALLERLLDATGEGVLLIEPPADIAYANAAARRLLGAGTLDPSTAARALDVEATVARVIASGAAVQQERDVHLPIRRRLALRFLPFDGRVLLLVQDVTEAHRAVQVRRDFVANVSHELKTPVTGIALLSEHLGHAIEESPQTAARFAERIRGEAERLGRLVGDLLDLSRIEGDLPLATSAFDAGELLREVAERIAVLAEAKGIALVLDAETVTVEADASQVATALANLLDNAVRYSPDGARVRARIEPGAGTVAFVVEDEGPGIPTEDVERIFERFYRVDKARSRATGGTGLGLAIVKHVAERHGGRVVAESELGRGSRFTLVLPRKAGAP